MLRRLRQHLLRGGDVEGDVAFAGLLGEQVARQACRVGIGVADQQPPPAALQGYRSFGSVEPVLRALRLQALVGRCLTAHQALAVGL